MLNSAYRPDESLKALYANAAAFKKSAEQWNHLYCLALLDIARVLSLPADLLRDVPLTDLPMFHRSWVVANGFKEEIKKSVSIYVRAGGFCGVLAVRVAMLDAWSQNIADMIPDSEATTVYGQMANFLRDNIADLSADVKFMETCINWYAVCVDEFAGDIVVPATHKVSTMYQTLRKASFGFGELSAQHQAAAKCDDWAFLLVMRTLGLRSLTVLSSGADASFAASASASSSVSSSSDTESTWTIQVHVNSSDFGGDYDARISNPVLLQVAGHYWSLLLESLSENLQSAIRTAKTDAIESNRLQEEKSKDVIRAELLTLCLINDGDFVTPIWDIDLLTPAQTPVLHIKNVLL